MHLFYFLFQGASFADVIQMTDIFEGSIIRLARRLDEFLNQVSFNTIKLEKVAHKKCYEFDGLPNQVIPY